MMVIDPTIPRSAVTWLNDAIPGDCFGLVQPAFNDTNGCQGVVAVNAAAPRQTRVERGLEFALASYDTLLKRLAD
jgi:hypothetical protein